LLGLASGDRVGGPTRMALRVAESLAENGAFDPDDIFGRYFIWWDTEGFDCGPTVNAVFQLVSSGTPRQAACIEVDRRVGGMTAGCNPAHRSVALALLGSLPDSLLGHAARAEAELTHVHPLAGDVAAATVRVCRALIAGRSWPEALSWGKEDRLPETQHAFDEVSQSDLSRSGYAPDVFGAALWFVGNSQSLDEALRRSIQFAGPSNYCPVLVGSIGGARWGVEANAKEWYAHHDARYLNRIRTVARALGTSVGG
jgi:ADP-ribosylglycohydrolase